MGRAKVTYVSEEGPAFAAGLNAFDEIIAMDGYQVSHSTLATRLKLRAGEEVTLTFFRRERIRELKVTLGSAHSIRISSLRARMQLKRRKRDLWHCSVFHSHRMMRKPRPRIYER